jgi:hypothetical protein
MRTKKQYASSNLPTIMQKYTFSTIIALTVIVFSGIDALDHLTQKANS